MRATAEEKKKKKKSERLLANENFLFFLPFFMLMRPK